MRVSVEPLKVAAIGRKMSLDPHKRRELVLLCLYSLELGDIIPQDMTELVMPTCKVAKKHVLEAITLAHKIWMTKEQCDQAISASSPEYRLERIGTVERAILRLVVYEITIEKSISIEIGIAEAKRLAKKFSTDESALFIHGLLGSIVQTTK
jgi:N utilization substance protein B